MTMGSKKFNKGYVVWFTGLPGSGKSTLAEGLTESLCNKQIPVEHLDGDVVRKKFPQKGFDREERCRHVQRVNAS